MVLHGRGREREAIDALLDAARTSSSGCLVIRGERGIGKSALLGYAADRAGGDLQVLRATGAPPEQGLAFAGLDQLLRPALGRLEALPEVQADALAGALGLVWSEGADRFLIGLATLSLLSAQAEDRPVVCLVDDLQWLDAESSDTLRFVARRLDAEGIALVFGTTELGNTQPGPGGIRELTVVGLDRVASDRLLIERSGTTPAPAVRAFIWEQTHGNPAALIEMTKALTAEQLEGVEPLPDAVRVGIALQYTFTARAGRLPDDTQTLLGLRSIWG